MLNERSPPQGIHNACFICMKVKKAKPTYAVRSQHKGYFWHMLRGSKQKEAQNVHQGKTDVLFLTLGAGVIVRFIF